jgi:hypothetical protein
MSGSAIGNNVFGGIVPLLAIFYTRGQESTLQYVLCTGPVCRGLRVMSLALHAFRWPIRIGLEISCVELCDPALVKVFCKHQWISKCIPRGRIAALTCSSHLNTESNDPSHLVDV